MNKIVNIVLGDLGLEIFKIQTELEYEINVTGKPIKTQVNTIKRLLNQWVMTELSIAKLQSLLPNNELKNGEV